MSPLPPLFWALQGGGWLLFAAALSLGRYSEHAPTAAIAATDWVSAALGFLITLGLERVYARADRAAGDREGPSVRRIAVGLAASFAAAALWEATYHAYLRGPAAAVVVALGAAPPHPGDGTLDPGGPLLDGIMHHSVAMLAWSAGYFGLRHYGALQAARERALRAEADAQRARLRALRYQLDPHFLFNTLNAVSTLVLEGDARGATGMLARLADFLRLTLAHDGAPEVPLAQELEFVRCYLAIEQVRFADRLRIAVEAPAEALAVPVPALILQPLVENAIRHAIAPRPAGGRVAVAVHLEPVSGGGALVLDVCDDGPGLGADASAGALPGTGVGLSNTRERLRHLYGDAYGLELRGAAGGGLCARVRMPCRVAPAPGVPARPTPAEWVETGRVATGGVAGARLSR